MLFAVIGSSAGKTRDEIMAISPRHKAFLDQFLTRGEVVGPATTQWLARTCGLVAPAGQVS